MITAIKPIQYGPHETRNEVTEAKIRFLEDSTNDSKQLPPMFRASEKQDIQQNGRLAYAERLRNHLLGLPIG